MTRIVKSQARVMASFTAPHVLTPSMHKLCFSSLVLTGTIICAMKPKKRKRSRMRRRKRKRRRMGWSHHSQRQDDKEVLE